MDFQIMEQKADRRLVPAVDKITGKPFIYPTQKEAAEAAKILSRVRCVKLKLQPVTDDAWKRREQQRFDNGNYKPVVWIGQDWFDKNRVTDHFVHVSVKDHTRIAFTRNDKDGAADVQTSMKPGKYLTEFFKMLTAEQVRTYAMQHSTTFENRELLFAKTPEEIEQVYKPSLGSSCFSGTTRANIYGSGDFAVAYIVDDAGAVKARAVCCPERKIYIHPYGDYARLTKLFEGLGYKNAYNRESWLGLRLLKEWHWDGFYADFPCRIAPDKNDPKKYLVIV